MIDLSDTAAAKIKEKISKRGKGLGLRIGVKTTGCSGLAYVLEYVDAATSNDIQYKSKDVVMFVDPKHLPYIDNLVVDYKKQGLNEGFEFTNPNEQSKCGCGQSFTVK